MENSQKMDVELCSLWSIYLISYDDNNKNLFLTSDICLSFGIHYCGVQLYVVLVKKISGIYDTKCFAVHLQHFRQIQLGDTHNSI